MKRLLLLLVLAALNTTCEKALIAPDPTDDPVENFELMWRTIDENYSFFTYKNIDWDSVYQVYRPLVNSQTNQFELFQIFSEMLHALRDGHVNLIAPFNFSRYWEWYLDFPENFNRNLLERHYWGDNYEISGPLINTVIDSVGYIYYESFGSTVSPVHIDYVLAKFEALEVKGVIFDIRNNGGGSLRNAERLAARFADRERLAYFTRYKNGPGHNDFYDQLVETVIGPDGPRQFTERPVVLLTNRRCFSAATFFTQLMRTFPNVTTMGDRTGGGGGLPIFNELPNGWRYRFSTTQTIDPEGFNIENGIPPDLRVDLDPLDEFRNIDTILEAALELFD